MSMTLIRPWTRWYAWRPVTLQNGKSVCFRTVEYEIWSIGDDSGAWPGGPTEVIPYRLPDDAPEFRMGSGR
jgi:hypothetical protein